MNASATRPADRPMTVGEFLAHDDGTDTRHKLVDGALVATNPPSGRHADICENIGGAIERQLKPPCRIYRTGVGVADARDGWTWRQPDLAVTCKGHERGYLREPRLVVEVLSPSTEKEDRTRKLDFYEGLPSIEAVLLVWQEERRVRLRRREDTGWTDHDTVGSGTLALADLGVTLDEIYREPWPEAEAGEAPPAPA